MRNNVLLKLHPAFYYIDKTFIYERKGVVLCALVQIALNANAEVVWGG